MTPGEALGTLSSRLCPWLQQHLQHLDNAFRTGRLGHAWLLTGPSGVGKRNLALVLAHRLLTPGAADRSVGVLDATRAADAMRMLGTPTDHHPDLHFLFPEEERKTISIDQVRDLAYMLSLKSFRGGAKVVIVEPAEAMTVAAANALLKTLEEPAPGTYILLISHQPGRLLPTIRSRCHTLGIAATDEDAVARWLGISEPRERDTLMSLGARAPLRILEMMQEDKVRVIRRLDEQLASLSRGKIDARPVADEWARTETDFRVTWLVRRLQEAIRARASGASDTNGVTSHRDDPLHNLWRGVSTDLLFERLARAEKLLEQLGSGINTELALHALLLSFQTSDRGRP